MKLKQTNSYKVSQSHHILNLATTGGRRIKRRLCTAPQSCYLCSTVCTYGVCIGVWIREHDPEYSSRSHVSSSMCYYTTDTLPAHHVLMEYMYCIPLGRSFVCFNLIRDEFNVLFLLNKFTYSFLGSLCN